MYQLYNQLKASKTFPVLALYHQTPGLKRRVLRTKYHEAEWISHVYGTNGAQAATQALTPGKTLLDAYLHYVETQDSQIWLTTNDPQPAHFMDVVVLSRIHS